MLLFGLFSAKELLSQSPLSQGAFSASAGTYQELTSYSSSYSNHSYSSMIYIYLPFDFYYDGRLTRYVSMSGSGGLKLSTSSSSPYYGSGFYKYQDLWDWDYMYYSSYYRYYGGFIYPFWMDHWPQVSSSLRHMRYYTTGTSPNRVAIFQWSKNNWDYLDDTYPNMSMNFQVKLYETSNEIEIQYGEMNRGGCDVCVDCGDYGATHGMIGFVGYTVGYSSSSTCYVNIDPNGNGNLGYASWEAGWNPLFGTELSSGYREIETVDNNGTYDKIAKGTSIRLTFGAKLVAEAPAEGVNLRLGYIYGNGTMDPSGYGNEQHPAIHVSRISGGATAHKTIAGPNSYPVHYNYQVIYDATNVIPNDTYTKFTTATPGATPNRAFGTATPGSLDLSTNQTSISGGTYLSTCDVLHNTTHYAYDYKFNIASDWDLEIKRIVSPKSMDLISYPSIGTIPVRLTYTNRGLNDVSAFAAIVKIINSAGDQVYFDTTYWSAPTPADKIALGEEVDIDFDVWNPYGITGLYTLTARIYFPGDQELTNNYWPWTTVTSDHVIKIAPETDAFAAMVMEPNNNPLNELPKEYYVGRPVAPRIRYQNLGINDISDAPSTVIIRHIGTNTEVYKRQNVIVTSIPAGMSFNETDQDYDYFTPMIPGDYEITARINSTDDVVETNNEIIDTFLVNPSLSGSYTIGPNKNTGNHYTDSVYNSKNFVTIRLAVDRLFLCGVAGPVTFEFTASNYDVGELNGDAPALDMRSFIYGVNSTNTVTFKPSAALSTIESAININLNSGIGVGIMFGQALDVYNGNAIVNPADNTIKPDYANSPGYIIFDGGLQRSLKFILHTNAKWNAAFFLSQGASNISIKNCVIISANQTESWKYAYIPIMKVLGSNFEYELNSRVAGSTYTYTAGIAMRSVAPQDKYLMGNSSSSYFPMTNDLHIDTLANCNNTIYNNKISGFAYGITSMGIGTLLDFHKGKEVRFYNKNNTISGNIIYNVSRAGIFLGFEENSTVKGNRISQVATTTTGFVANTDVGGILLGGERASTSNLGYNNIGVKLDGNEIFNVGQALTSANYKVFGIKVEQVENKFGTQLFPDVDENMIIMNNSIWGLKGGVTSVNKVAIALYTERKVGEPNWLTKLLTPQSLTYFSVGDKIVNNTIYLTDDGFATTQGIYAGISLQNCNNALIMNNAIAMTDQNNSGNTNIYSAIVYMGLLPWTEDAKLTSDRNVFYLNGGSDLPDMYRYLQLDANSNILNYGARNEFATLNQWQMFSQQDFISTFDDFTTEFTTPLITDPLSKLRIKNTPTWPTGSKLNNRGENLTFVGHDIDGNSRGMMSQRYDIGAYEFPGILLTTDAEIAAISEPGAYLASSSTFSNAEHIMTEAPVEVKALIRNNGSLPQSGLKAMIKIYREDPQNPGTFYTTPEIDESVNINVPVSDAVEVGFNLADKIVPDFIPLSYGDWKFKYEGTDFDPDSMYTIPSWYMTMVNNVTPLYRIVISTQSDEDISNNVLEKVVRFYLKRSIYGIVLSVDNSPYDAGVGASNDVLAGRRNYDSLVAGLTRLGWVNQWSTAGEYPELLQYYDVFERSAWEPRAVDYTLYRTVIWSDDDENALSSFEKIDLTKFNESATAINKKNLIIGSQEMMRLNYTADSSWVKNTLFVKRNASYPTDPNSGSVYSTSDLATRYLIGETIARTLKQSILRTSGSPADPGPVPGLVSLYTDGKGLTRSAYNYNAVSVTSPTPKEISAGAATIALTVNTVYLAVDWRHFGDIELALRAVIDFCNINDGNVIPVELASFNAKPLDNRVDISWETASEFNSSHFEVERADVSEAGVGSFVKIAREDASGKSNSTVTYGPVTDRNVVNGRSYVYRLKMVDLDGKFNYSNEIQVTVGGAGNMSLSEPLPNPAGYQTLIQYTIPENSNVYMAIYDITGKNVLMIADGYIAAGLYSKNLDLSSLNSGTYNIVFNCNGNTITKQLVIVR